MTTKGTWKAAERSVAEALGKWWCNDPKAFGRCPCSGGFSTRHKSTEAVGDIVPLTEAARSFPFSVEVKLRKGWDLSDMVLGLHGDKKTDVLAWWSQTVRDAERPHKIPMLVFRKPNARGSILAVPRVFMSEIGGYCNVRLPRLVYMSTECAIVLFSFHAWLGAVDAEAVRAMISKHV